MDVYIFIFSMIIIMYGFVPYWMLKTNYNRIRDRYWGKNKNYPYAVLKYNLIICSITFLLIVIRIFSIITE